MIWEHNRAIAAASDKFGGKRAPRSQKLASLRRAYLEAYRDIAERLTANA